MPGDPGVIVLPPGAEEDGTWLDCGLLYGDGPGDPYDGELFGDPDGEDVDGPDMPDPDDPPGGDDIWANAVPVMRTAASVITSLCMGFLPSIEAIQSKWEHRRPLDRSPQIRGYLPPIRLRLDNG